MEIDGPLVGAKDDGVDVALFVAEECVEDVGVGVDVEVGVEAGCVERVVPI